MGHQTEQAGLTDTNGASSGQVLHSWTILLLSVLVWFPVASYWQSDDFIALHYVTSWTRTWSDFVGGHYGLESLVVFYRPLITLSFAIEQTLGSWAQPFLSHFTNVLAHGISAVCLAAILRRFASPRQAFAGGLVWALAPNHVSSLFWAVGRVDSHTTMWIALSTLFLLQGCEGRRTRHRLALLCFVMALLSKELALVMPGIALVFGFVMAPRGSRVRGALRCSWRFLVILILYFAWRTLLFGSPLTGYESQLQIQDSLVGLGVLTAELVNPLLHSGMGLSGLPSVVAWLGFLPICLALVAVISGRRTALLLTILALFLGCSVPMLQIWPDTNNPLHLRTFYLPMMPLAGLLAIGGWRSAGPALLVFALPLAELQLDYHKTWRRCEALHQAILQKATAKLNFIDGLPSLNGRGTALLFHLGVDRLTRPPFATSQAAVYALRPMSQAPSAWRVSFGAARAMPFGETFAVEGFKIRTAPAGTRPTNIELRLNGTNNLTLAVLDQIVKNYQAKLSGRPTTGKDPAMTLVGLRAERYRVTILTANGYLTTFLPDMAGAGSKNGRIELGPILMGDLNKVGSQKVGDLLQHATALDLSLEFPILVEADLRPGSTPATFQTTHANRQPIWVRLPRLFANWWP